MQTNKSLSNIEQVLFKIPSLLLENHVAQDMQSPYTRNMWLSLLPPDLNEILKLIQCDSDKDMLMRNYLYTANNWLPFVVGTNAVACGHDLANKLNSLLQTQDDLERWQLAVREVFEHMHDCYQTKNLAKLKKLNKDWRDSVFVRTKSKAA